MTTQPAARVYRAPTKHVPFLEAFRATYGPVGLLSRVFLIVDERLREHGISLEFGDFDEVVELHRHNRENWSFFNPMFDPRRAVIDPEAAFCLIGRDRHGRPLVTGSGKVIDTGNRTLTEAVDKGIFYGLKAEQNTTGIYARMTAAAASSLRGRFGYTGGIWVDPTLRGAKLAGLVGNIVNACLLTLWDPDYIIGLVRNESAGTGYQERYGFSHSDRSLLFYEHDTMVSAATLLWMTADDAALSIGRFLDQLWPQIDAAIVAGRR